MKHLSLIVCAFAVLACTHTTAPKMTSEAQAVLEKMQAATAQNQFYFGQEDFAFYGTFWEYEPGRSDVKEVCGSAPAVLGCDLGHLELDATENLDGVPFDVMRSAMVSQYQAGGLVTVSWHARNPLTGGDAWDISDSTVVASILAGGANHEKFMSWLEKVAVFLESVKTPDGKLVPIIFRPWHEHSGSWFWWGKDLCSVEEYNGLWVMTMDYLRGRGLTNLITAISPNAVITKESYLERYPGDDYIDIFGLDAYDNVEATQYVASTREQLAIVADLAKAHGKIAALTECGLGGLPKAQWYTQTVLPIVDGIPVAYVLVWRNAQDSLKPGHFYAPYPGHPASEDFIQFFQDSRTRFLGE